MRSGEELESGMEIILRLQVKRGRPGGERWWRVTFSATRFLIAAPYPELALLGAFMEWTLPQAVCYSSTPFSTPFCQALDSGRQPILREVRLGLQTGFFTGRFSFS
jgi:hypothetical protein